MPRYWLADDPKKCVRRTVCMKVANGNSARRRALAIRQRNKASHCWTGWRSCHWSWQLRWERSRRWRAVPKCDPRGISMPPRNATLLEEVHRSLTAAVRERRRAARLLDELNADVDAARRVFQAESDKRDQEQERVSEGAEAVGAAEREVLASIGALAEAYRQWCAAVVVLAPAAVPEVVPEISSWCEENMAATSPVRAAVDQAMENFHRGVASERAAKEQELRSAEEKLRVLSDEQERLSKGEHQPPPPPYTRDPESRRARDGAPFWMLCEFFEDVPAEHRAAIGAALQKCRRR